ncbi:prolipoprotein diacylglyceryl transferase [Agilicoccus flavus]|uniref:prolipoprotein diacylglyceryl transferase n=1 Tax=Agilicoccus flavus TaxID=2775968 RepID=UPI001CF68BCD|nr:prolipoprotein diacylglyceryl transferase [Agilicoccus flavus]
MFAAIPSPDQGVWYLGPFPLRAYALCILLGIVVATVWTGRRLEARGGDRDAVLDVAVWAVPFGIVGGRLYHVASSWQPYFGPGGHPVDALKIWQGGLGIWGAVALGAVGAWIGCRRAGVDYLTLADSLAPPLLAAQAIGRLGNWFNNELYGAPTDAPWALEIHAWDHALGRATVAPDGAPVVLGTFHPTFLYELLWCLAAAAVLVAVGRRRGPLYRRQGQLMALYLVAYTMGRGVIENVRIDEANHVLGLRLNVWTSVLVLAFGLAWWWWLGRRGRPAIEPHRERVGSAAADAASAPRP